MQVRQYRSGDEDAICDIYNHYITETAITFEEAPLSRLEMRERIESYLAHYPWLVCESGNEIVGYSYASRFRPRAAYRFTAEATVYVRRGCERRGFGKALYDPLLCHLQDSGCHVLVAAIALPNAGSVGLHEAFGFAKVAHFPEVGFKFGRWLDVGYWQKNLIQGSAD